MGCDVFSSDYALPQSRNVSGSVDAKNARRRDMLPTLVVGWRASVLRREEAGHFREVAGMSIIAAGGPHSR